MLPSNTLPWSFCRKIRQMVPKSKQTLNDRHSPSYFYYAFKPLSGAYMLGYYFPHLTASTGSAVYLPSHVNPKGFWWTSNPVSCDSHSLYPQNCQSFPYNRDSKINHAKHGMRSIGHPIAECQSRSYSGNWQLSQAKAFRPIYTFDRLIISNGKHSH